MPNRAGVFQRWPEIVQINFRGHIGVRSWHMWRISPAFCFPLRSTLFKCFRQVRSDEKVTPTCLWLSATEMETSSISNDVAPQAVIPVEPMGRIIIFTGLNVPCQLWAHEEALVNATCRFARSVWAVPAVAFRSVPYGSASSANNSVFLGPTYLVIS